MEEELEEPKNELNDTIGELQQTKEEKGASEAIFRKEEQQLNDERKALRS
jgi:peptidoglycan hydrolase CwlO-like protein